jgi:N6-L-threonylcarbamoyladenine synthase
VTILGIETSCDETGVALLSNGKLLANKVYSQLVHARFGGVVPEIASREHTKKLLPLFNQILEETECSLNNIDTIAVTFGPGLLCCLLVGLNFAKGLSYSKDIPIIGINHLEAHIYSPFITHEEFPYPFLSLLVSGGHTQITKVNGLGNYEVLGYTLDDACGEAFDKVSKLIGLGYPGGPEIEKRAERGNAYAFDFPIPDPDGLNFSYSGLKTSVLYLYQDLPQEDKIRRIQDIAASFQRVAIESLIIKLERAIEETGIKYVSVSGGVSANKLLKKRLGELDVECVIPDLEFTMDNAAMIAFLGNKLFKKGIKSDLKIRAEPRLGL